MEQPVDEAVYQNWRLSVAEYSDLPAFRHTFSHFHLDITPCEVDLGEDDTAVADESRYQWHEDIESLALAAPVSQIMKSVK
jgi:A/G-specific adenine glycosylase